MSDQVPRRPCFHCDPVAQAETLRWYRRRRNRVRVTLRPIRQMMDCERIPRGELLTVFSLAAGSADSPRQPHPR